MKNGFDSELSKEYNSENVPKNNSREAHTMKEFHGNIEAELQGDGNSKQFVSEGDLSKLDLKLKEIQKGEKKQQSIKKPKIVIDNFSEYIPQFLLQLSQVKHKSVIRIGKNYQAQVPTNTSYSYIYRPLSHLRVWDARQFQPSILKKFREKFGDSRTEEDLCLLMLQYQCDWNEVCTYMSEFKGELRKNYLQKDRNKS